MGERLAGGNVALALLANTIATAAALFALIQAFGPLSGAHFNPLVSAAAWRSGALSLPDLSVYLAAQFTGGVVGMVTAHLMFGFQALTLSSRARPGWEMALSEGVATCGLLLVIGSIARHRSNAAAAAVAAYVASAYWFTSSTSFANPAVTVARAFTDTFAGIAWGDVPLFIAGQIAGALTAGALLAWFRPSSVRRQT